MSYKKVIKVELTPQSIDDAIKAIEEYKKWIEDCTERLVEKLADKGVILAQIEFDNAPLDGTGGNPEVVVTRTKDGRFKCTVQTNETVLASFIEFGTGITYPDVHPYASQLGAIRGQYGQGKGSRPNGWTFYDVDYYGQKRHTLGIPASMPMYKTEQQLEKLITQVANEVFR